MNRIHYVWDLSDDSEDTVYAVEYRGRLLRHATDLIIGKARRAAFERTGNRKAMKRTNDSDYPYQDGLTIVPVPLATRPLKEWKGRKRQAIAEFEFGDEMEMEDFLWSVQNRMGDNEYWCIKGKNIDWRGRDGYKYVHAATASTLLEAIYKEDILRMYCGRKGDRFEINAPTHDTPMGSFYEFVPVQESTYHRYA